MPLSKITDIEKEQFMDAVNEYSASYCDVGVKTKAYDYILRHWNTAKSNYLYKLLGEKLIISKPFTYEKSKDDICQEIKEKVIGYPVQEFIIEFNEKVVQDPQFISVNHPTGYRIQWFLEYLVSSSALADNIYKDGTFEIISPKTGKKIQIAEGCKVSKILGKIAREWDLKGYEEFRIAHSQILNNKKMTGTLCLSIHPNDYATMSDNDYGWDSCMSWWNNGGYCQGTVEMMNSSSVLVAYVRGDKNMKFGNEDWSNKKWRELFIVDHDIIAEIAPYPYENKSITKAALDWIRDLAITNLNWEWLKDAEVSNWNDGKVIIDDAIYHINFESNAMYNDFRFNHLCYLNFEEFDSESVHFFNYSGISECLNCGESHNDWESLFDHEGCLICAYCDCTFYCTCCGEHHHGQPYHVNGSPVCEYCYDNYTMVCNSCGDRILLDDSIRLYLGRGDEGWITTEFCDDYEFCHDCYEEFIKRICVPSKTQSFSTWGDHYIDIRDLTEEAVKEILGVDSIEEALQYRPNAYHMVDI